MTLPCRRQLERDGTEVFSNSRERETYLKEWGRRLDLRENEFSKGFNPTFRISGIMDSHH